MDTNSPKTHCADPRMWLNRSRKLLRHFVNSIAARTAVIVRIFDVTATPQTQITTQALSAATN